MKHLSSVLDTLKAPWATLVSGQRGVTGLETAIILIAFVVVASVFAFTVLSTGIFSAERGKETVYARHYGAERLPSLPPAGLVDDPGLAGVQ